MAFLVPSQAFGGGSPELGALTGLFGGLAQGIQAQRQQQLAQQHLQLQQADQALRQRAYEHGLTQEHEQDEFFKALGQYATTARPTQAQGPSTAGATFPPASGIGPPETVGPSSPPMVPPDLNARLQQAQSIASTIKSPQAFEAFMTEIHREESQRAVQGQAQAVLGGISDRIAQGSYRHYMPGGVIDPSGEEAAKALLEQARNFTSGPAAQNPQGVAQFLDHLEQEDLKLRQHGAESDVEMHMRDIQAEDMARQIEERRGQPGSSPADTQAQLSILYNFKRGLITREEAAKQFSGEMSGEAPLKRKEIQSRIDWERVHESSVQTPEQKMALAMARIQAWGATRENLQSLADASREKVAAERDQTRRELAGERGNAKDTQNELAIRAAARTAAGNRDDFKRAKTPEERRAIIDEEYQTLKNMGGAPLPTSAPPGGGLRLPGAALENGIVGPKAKDSAASILDDFRSGRTDRASAIQRATTLGYKSFDELQAAAKGP